jgi:hypothetical protein
MYIFTKEKALLRTGRPLTIACHMKKSWDNALVLISQLSNEPLTITALLLTIACHIFDSFSKQI